MRKIINLAFVLFALYLELAKGGTERGSEKERYKSKRFFRGEVDNTCGSESNNPLDFHAPSSSTPPMYRESWNDRCT